MTFEILEKFHTLVNISFPTFSAVYKKYFLVEKILLEMIFIFKFYRTCFNNETQILRIGPTVKMKSLIIRKCKVIRNYR